MTILIETPRLIMREFTLDDLDAVYEFSVNEDVTKYTGDLGMVKTKQDAKDVITNVWQAEYKKYGYARYALVYKENNHVIGFCGIKYLPEENRPDVGYRMLPEYWGKGLGLEAVRATMDYANNTLKLENIMAEAVVENIASNKILLKVGLKHVDTYERWGFKLNRYE
ncbi:GNAT family N-acetyltransferase [Pseudoalteromonas denitrificans]|jgi:RimJ/RimL family protein N-acetyltransferase|uniref:Protein N-acetyltransferase, RimJ/RimL family n=1 Tax=Pseudoalteromonas denitrificans DSM 6059 TaxID=1123010 RepID=A0A1I1KUV1_9GAMM|nr:GNAT family N-acetyltransferase [Pseudoalteromonas denitrificans]SFC61230.1 Protein N-acetyltransferase, RimJ/RimL family [Pseudoalteromonas denitrificans DSM 6059]